eukprot:7381538-Prymnesium_polylepis.1
MSDFSAATASTTRGSRSSSTLVAKLSARVLGLLRVESSSSVSVECTATIPSHRDTTTRAAASTASCLTARTAFFLAASARSTRRSGTSDSDRSDLASYRSRWPRLVPTATTAPSWLSAVSWPADGSISMKGSDAYEAI